MSAAERRGGVAVLLKAGALLDVLAEREAAAAEIADAVGEPRSSIYRLLATLSELEYVEPGIRRGTYRLGVKLLRLGSAVMESLDERERARPVMEEIHDATGETVFLCVRRGFAAVCIERIEGKQVGSLALPLGGALPLHAGAAPRALLAYEPEEFWERYIAAGSLTEMTPTTPVTRDTLIPILKSIREEGISISDQDVTIGIAAVGAPILDFSGHARGALSVSGIRDGIIGDGSRARELVSDGAARVSHQFGYRGKHR